MQWWWEKSSRNYRKVGAPRFWTETFALILYYLSKVLANEEFPIGMGPRTWRHREIYQLLNKTKFRRELYQRIQNLSSMVRSLLSKWVLKWSCGVRWDHSVPCSTEPFFVWRGWKNFMQGEFVTTNRPSRLWLTQWWIAISTIFLHRGFSSGFCRTWACFPDLIAMYVGRNSWRIIDFRILIFSHLKNI
jgi:hypothetical protein